MSRKNIKKVFVEEAIKNAQELPSPDSYASPNYFGKRQGEIACDSRQFTMGKKIDDLKTRLKKEMVSPGPGYYNAGNNLADDGSSLVPN